MLSVRRGFRARLCRSLHSNCWLLEINLFERLKICVCPFVHCVHIFFSFFPHLLHQALAGTNPCPQPPSVKLRLLIAHLTAKCNDAKDHPLALLRVLSTISSLPYTYSCLSTAEPSHVISAFHFFYNKVEGLLSPKNVIQRRYRRGY